MAPRHFLFFLVALAYSQDVSTICKKVAERYRSLDTYSAEAEYTFAARSPAGSVSANAKFKIVAIESTKKLRIQLAGTFLPMTIVSDGTVTWTYLPEKKVYTKVEAVAQVDAGDESDSEDQLQAMALYQNLIPKFTRLDEATASIHLAGEQELKTAGGKVRCWILVRSVGDQMEKDWIDEQRFLVLRTEDSMSAKEGSRVAAISVKRFDFDKPQESLFTFEAKAKDQLVDVLPLPNAAPNLVGRPALDFTLKTIDGDQTRLSDLKGKIVVLDFWATWCPPCRRELPTIDRLANRLKDKDVVFLGINDEGSSTVKGFYKKHEYSFTTLEDNRRAVQRAYHANAIPSVFIIDRNGIVVQHLVGSREEPELMAGIKAAGLR